MFLESPRSLSLIDGSKLIGDIGTIHSFHVYGHDCKGRLKICYADDWEASMNVIMVLLRGIIWVDGLSNYFTTGETIAAYIDNRKKDLDGSET
ncbi:hypothetical protein ACFL6U_12645 [Planctomycetota bacterium]